jgi:hypothetical protein
MGIDLAKLDKKLCRMLGLDDPDVNDDENLPKAERIDIFNISFWEIADKFPFREKEATATFSTVAGTPNYDIPVGTEAVRNVSGKDDELQHFDIAPMSPEEYESLLNENSNERAIPTRYVRETCMIRLWPTPDDTYTIIVKHWKELADMLNDADQPGVPRNWHEIVLYGAAWRGFLELGDISRANGFTNYQHKLMNSVVPTEQKEQQDYKYAGVQLIRNSYDEFIDPHSISSNINRRNFDTK